MRRRLAAGLMIVMGWTLATLPGCNRTLFPEDAPRTPYEKYQAFRGQSRQAKTTDAFGREQPDLRARLAPLSQ